MGTGRISQVSQEAQAQASDLLKVPTTLRQLYVSHTCCCCLLRSCPVPVAPALMLIIRAAFLLRQLRLLLLLFTMHLQPQLNLVVLAHEDFTQGCTVVQAACTVGPTLLRTVAHILPKQLVVQ
jgi:hypothetical protein